jgi:diguanylate cyclase (GGDEF)-like protein
MRDEVFWRKDGTSFWVEYNATPTRVNDEVTGAVVVFADVSDRRESEIQLEKMARFDLLTGLPNRANFLDTLERAVVRAERTNASLAVCLFDIDNFKQINDNFGHEMGDELLKALPEVLKNVLRGVDYLARLGGDEFGLIVEDFGSAVEVGAIVGRYITTISEPIFIGSDEINTTVSVGVAIHPSAGKTAQELIKNADIAMYKAKEDGKNKLSFFNTEISTQIKRQHKVDMAMRKAVVNNEFYLLYQPQVDIETNQLVGVEALVRWDNPSLETTSPAEFIPMAEENGLILEIGEWVLQQAVKDSLWLNENIKEGLKVSINVSVRQLERDDFAQSVSAIFNRYGVDSRQIYLEVTETALMQHSERIVATMSLLDQMGVRFALDDFGMGYSSMHYLKRMPISLIKIDQNFVRDIASDAGDAAIVRAIIDLAHAMNIPTIAEGVEENGQLLQLLEYGCEQVQGYYFAKPMRIDDLHEWYLKRQGKVTE